MSSARRALRVGLTGGLATGKSTVLAVLAGCGAATIDADVIARQVLAPGSPLLGAVRQALGDEVFQADGSLDRARTAALVFRDEGRRRALEAIVHPEVIRREEAEANRLAQAGAAVVVVDAALLIEAGRAGSFDRLVVVACPPAEQLRRATARGMSAADAGQRIAAQMPTAEKIRLADYVVDTGGALDETRARARRLWEHLLEDAAALVAGRPLPDRR